VALLEFVQEGGIKMTCGPWFDEEELRGHPYADSILGTDAFRTYPEVLRRTDKWADMVGGLRLYAFEVLQEVPGKAIGAMIEARGYALSPRKTYQELDALWRSLMPNAKSQEMFYWDYVDNGYYVPTGTVILATMDSETLSREVAEFMAKCSRRPCEDEEAWGLQGCQECYDQTSE
jgi:hypothetical protein